MRPECVLSTHPAAFWPDIERCRFLMSGVWFDRNCNIRSPLVSRGTNPNRWTICAPCRRWGDEREHGIAVCNARQSCNFTIKIKFTLALQNAHSRAISVPSTCAVGSRKTMSLALKLLALLTLALHGYAQTSGTSVSSTPTNTQQTQLVVLRELSVQCA